MKIESIPFEISQHSKYPVHEQIKEQIKLAISLGHLKPGDPLPSVRQLETQLGVGRALIHRAYRELQRSGIVAARSRSGVMVNPKIVLPTSDHRAQRCEALVRRLFSELDELGLLKSSFAALLYQRAVAREQVKSPIAYVESIKTEALECARQISRLWETNVVAVSLDEFSSVKRSDISYRWVLTPFYDYEWVARIAKRLGIDVAPVVLKYSGDFITELTSVLKEARALIILADQDFERHGDQLMAELREGVGADRSQKLFALPYSKVKSIEKVTKSKQYKRVYIGNRIWDSLDDRIKELPNVGHPRVEIDSESLQRAKVKLGLMV